MIPVGIVSMPLIFPHTKGSLRLLAEFVVMKDAICDYLILRNDTFCLYGIDIIQSKNRYFTIGNDWKRKFQICNIQASNMPQISTSEMNNFDQKYLSQSSIGDNLNPDQRNE